MTIPRKILLSTAYLPPVEYFSRILEVQEILIEREENYLKQTYRNRCYILSANGPLSLTVPVYTGSFHKTPVKEIKIDYSKRWQQVHLGAITSSYNSSPYLMYYFETIERIILSGHKFLIDLNMDLLQALLAMLKIDASPSYTKEFSTAEGGRNDFRYNITPKRKPDYTPKKYMQVFSPPDSFNPGLSIIDLVFNTGPEAKLYL
jgi:hypothetical protein